MLKADELLIVSGKRIGEFFPPAPPGRVLREFKKERATRPGDGVVVEQPLDFLWLQAGPGQLVPADLRRRPSQCRGNGIPALSLAFPDSPQLRCEPTATHRGASWHGHRASLPPPASRELTCVTCVTDNTYKMLLKLSLKLTLRSPQLNAPRRPARATLEEKATPAPGCGRRLRCQRTWSARLRQRAARSR